MSRLWTNPGHAPRGHSDVYAAALCQAGRLDDSLLAKGFKEETLDAAHARFRGGLGLQQLLLESAKDGGYDAGIGGRIGGDLGNVLRAAFSTLSLPGILADTASKFLLAGYLSVEGTWRRVASISNHKDFRTVTGYRLGGGLKFEPVGPGGRLKHGTVGEESYTNRVDTYGKMFSVTRQDIINDDLGAMTALPRRLGRGGGLKLNDVFWAEFLSGHDTFFTAARGNYFEGAATNLQSSSLKTAVEKFRKQTDSDGSPLGAEPRTLLVPPELETTADELFVSTNHNAGGGSTADRVPNANTFGGKYRPAVSSYLSNSSFTGSSATAWYLMADPMDEPTVDVAFLGGQETPTVESAEADFSTLGIAFRGFWDFGVAKRSYRGAVKSKGAA